MEDPEHKVRKRNYYRKGRATGDIIYYFSLHNVISMILFFVIALQLELFEEKTETISQLFSMIFIEMLVTVFALSIITGLFARFIAYLIIYLIMVKWRGREIKKFGEINSGLNRMGMAYILSILISAVLFSIGAIVILELMLFNEESLVALIITYSVMKIGVFLLVRMFTSSKL